LPKDPMVANQSRAKYCCFEKRRLMKTDTMRRHVIVFLAIAAAGLLVLLAAGGRPAVPEPGHRMTALSQTFIAVDAGAPLHVPPLVTANGRTISPKQLQGHWSVIFFGFTACPLVCPATLSLLTAVAHNPQSGIASGVTQPVFISVDPDNDTPQRLSVYLQHFDRHILGLTGSRDAVAGFSRAIGAGYQSAGSSIDHSTSLFVVDPKGRLAGILLRPKDPARIVGDLARLRLSYDETLAAEGH
jgi:protein SCO1/2